MSAPRVVPLSPANLPDRRRLFAAGAAAGAWWGHCQCFIWHFRGDMDAWDARTPVENEAAFEALVRADAAHGLLAYDGEEPVGWCRAGRRSEFAWTLGREEAPPDAATRGVVTCFIVRPEWRGRGVARALLAATDAHLRSLGCTTAEAYPLADGVTAHDGMQGRLRWFLDAGWREVRALGTDARLVRKPL